MVENELVSAAALGENAEAERLLAGGASPDEPDEDGDTALYRAAVQGHADIVRMLLAAGADPDREGTGDGGGLPLCAAACWGHLDAVVALLDAGADPNRREDEAGSAMTALHWAASNEHLAVVNTLLARGAAPDLGGATGRTALSHAAARGATAVVRTLLDHGAHPGVRDDQGRRPVDLALPYAGRDIEAELRAEAAEHAPQGARIDIRREESEGGDVRIVAEVYDADGDLRSERSLSTGHAEIVRLLHAREPEATHRP
ncbi:ankyrin repeat domain-containing protein [Rhizohabitans arisaemae]|uniref:ankyrin repeat domain-containing protein n=1 Tax=Rhizohabitans arisaemae TaxID=2720610 RepID=UPI0024B1FE60|nr:ankyrin repeat domain-containing protein [Rhizohabitans arisaemae]